MAIEIERKFLLRNDSWRERADSGTAYRQGYLTDVTADPGQKSSIRVRIEGNRAFLNIKSAALGVRRTEFEYPVPVADAEAMLLDLCLGPAVEKTRYRVPHGGHTWEIDVFAGANAGLVVAEIELPSEDADFEKPDWLGDEVSHDQRYYNVCLVRHPYREWKSKE